METSTEGELRVGLQFCSFQASLDQFDVCFNDWCMNQAFPSAPGTGDPGPDALLDPGRGFTTLERFGLYFVPPYEEAGLAAAIFGKEPAGRKPTRGRLVVHKRVVDGTNSNRRFERRGFGFQVLDGQGQPIGEVFTTDSTGRAVFGGQLELETTYTLQEVVLPIANVAPSATSFVMDSPNKQLMIENTVTQPNSPYGG